MDTPYPAQLPPVLYHVNRERVRAGLPPIILKNPRYYQDDKYYVIGDRSKTPYRIERCWPTAQEACEKVKEIALDEVRQAQFKLSELDKKVRRARSAAESMLLGL